MDIYSEAEFASVAGLLSGLTGLSVLLRSRRGLSKRNLIEAILYQSLMGLAISGIWIHYRPGEYWLALSASILIGLSGMSAREALARFIMKPPDST